MRRFKVYLVLLAVFLLGVFSSFLGFYQLRARASFDVEEKFLLRSYDFEVTLNERLKRNKSLLQACAGFVQASTYVSKDEWQEFVKAFNLNKTFPEVRWLGLAKVIQEGSKFTEEFRQKEEKDFRIWPSSTVQSIPLIYIYPKTYDELIGYNFYTSKNLVPLFGNEDTEADVTITNGLSFIPSDKVTSAFLFFYPIIEGNKEKGKPRFWTIATIDLFVMVSAVADGLNLKDVNIQIFEGKSDNPSNLIFERVIQKEPTPLFQTERVIKIGDRELTFKFTATPEYRSELHTEGAYLLLFAYLAATCIFVFILYKYLGEKGGSGSNLEKSDVLDHIQMGIFVTNLEGTITCYNTFCERHLGFTKGEVLDKMKVEGFFEGERTKALGEEFSKKLNKELKNPFEIFIAQCEKGVESEIEWQLVRKDKSTFPALMYVSKLVGYNQEHVGYLGVFRLKNA